MLLEGGRLVHTAKADQRYTLGVAVGDMNPRGEKLEQNDRTKVQLPGKQFVVCCKDNEVRRRVIRTLYHACLSKSNYCPSIIAN
jgi:hypothetical protein